MNKSESQAVLSGYSLQALVLVDEALKEGLLGRIQDLHRGVVSHALLIATKNQAVRGNKQQS